MPPLGPTPPPLTGASLFDIAGRVALVTGSSRGIGHALASGLLSAGCTVIINGRDGRRLEGALVADPEFSDWVRRRTPAGRWGEVADLVGPLLFLAGPASDFVNGQVLYVDGGMLSVL